MSRTIENPYENFIALSRYARWISEENRRETWGETVDRYFDFMKILNFVQENSMTPFDYVRAFTNAIVGRRAVLHVSKDVHFTT